MSYPGRTRLLDVDRDGSDHGCTMRAPLTATFFAVELTGNTHVLVPLIAACATAHAVTVLLMKRSIPATEKIARRGHHIVREYQVDPFALTRVHEVMARDVETVPSSMTLYEAARFLYCSGAKASKLPNRQCSRPGPRHHGSTIGSRLETRRKA